MATHFHSVVSIHRCVCYSSLKRCDRSWSYQALWIFVFSRKAKIQHHYSLIVQAKCKVIWLNISMKIAKLMQKLNRIQHLIDVVQTFFDSDLTTFKDRAEGVSHQVHDTEFLLCKIWSELTCNRNQYVHHYRSIGKYACSPMKVSIRGRRKIHDFIKTKIYHFL